MLLLVMHYVAISMLDRWPSYSTIIKESFARAIFSVVKTYIHPPPCTYSHPKARLPRRVMRASEVLPIPLAM